MAKRKSKEEEKKITKKAAAKKTAAKKPVAKKSTTKKAVVKKAAPKKETAKKTTAKKATTKKAEPKKTTAKKASPKKETAKKVTNKKTTAKKTEPKKVTPKKAEPKKAAAKKTTKKATAKKTVAKKSEPKKTIKKSASKSKKTEEPQITPPKPNVKYSNEDLQIFHKRILEVREEAIEELRMLRERLDDLTNYDFAEESMIYSMHMAEQGSEAFEKEKTYAQIQRINEYIKKLDDALARVKDKTYGICRVCGCLIAKERLIAVPITTLSASYKIQKKCPDDGIDRIEPVKRSI